MYFKTKKAGNFFANPKNILNHSCHKSYVPYLIETSYLSQTTGEINTKRKIKSYLNF